MSFELETLDELLGHVRQHGNLDGVVCQGLDLRGQDDLMLICSVNGAAFLGCRLSAAAIFRLMEAGALVLPPLPNIPYRAFRSRLYSVDELMQGYWRGQPGSYRANALDSHIYQHYNRHRNSRGPVPILETLAQRLHDHGIDDALSDLLAKRDQIVAIMGGHGMKRGEPAYRTVARIARELTRRGLFVATGGGPGAMEAGNLGAWLAPHADTALDTALNILTGDEDYRSDHYLELACQVRDRYPTGGQSLAIPTWFYGHEPTNLFASHIAKYFANSIREEGLLAIANRGVVYAPGSAGTIQEIFMDAAQNHYGTFEVVSPMVFLGRSYWSEQKPIYPLLRRLAAGKQYERLLAISDSATEIVALISEQEPLRYDPGS